MTPRKGLAPLLLAGVLVAQPLLAQAHHEPADTVRLGFAWAPGTMAEVITERSRDRYDNGVRTSGSATLRYRMTLEPESDGFLVRYDAFTGDSAGSVAPELAAHLSGFTPTYRVSRAGEFRELGDPAAARALIDSLLAPLRDELAANPGARELLAGVTSDAALRMNAEQEWNLLVGTWAGAEFVIGSAYASSVTETVPILGGISLPMEYEFSAIERVPCDSTDTALGCVALQMISRPDPDVVSETVARALAKVMPDDAEAIAAADFEVQNTVHLVARPESLVPYRLTVTKELALTLPDGTGGMSEYLQVEVRDQIFRWR